MLVKILQTININMCNTLQILRYVTLNRFTQCFDANPCNSGIRLTQLKEEKSLGKMGSRRGGRGVRKGT